MAQVVDKSAKQVSLLIKRNTHATSIDMLTVPVNFRLSVRSYKALQELAAKDGLRLSPFLRSHIYKLLRGLASKEVN